MIVPLGRYEWNTCKCHRACTSGNAGPRSVTEAIPGRAADRAINGLAVQTPSASTSIPATFRAEYCC
jgi:hypothetical protein